MTSIADQLQQLLQQRAQQAPTIASDYSSALSTAADQDQQSIDQLRGIYSDPSKFERSAIGAMGLGLMKGTKSGRFNESMYNGLAAATAVKDYNQEQNLSREEKLAKLAAIEATLTRQKAQDQLGVYDTTGKVITNMQGDQQTMADIELQKGHLGSRPLGVGEQGPVADDQSVEAQAGLVYQDYMRNPQKYQGPQGQAMVKSAVDTLNNVRNNNRYIQVQQMRQQQGAGQGRVMPNSPEGRRISGRLKGFDEAADAGREIMGNVSKLRRSRDAVSYEGTPGAGMYSGWLGWASDDAAAGQLVTADATNFKLELTAKLKGAISDAEQAMLTSASPGLGMADAAADPLMMGYQAAGQRAVERSKFMKMWFQQNGHDYGADEAWDAYVAENPILGQDDQGNLVVNEKNVNNWQGYLQGGVDGQPQQQQGGGYPDNPDEVVGTDAQGNEITWGDIITTAEKHGMTVEQVIEKLGGSK